MSLPLVSRAAQKASSYTKAGERTRTVNLLLTRRVGGVAYPASGRDKGGGETAGGFWHSIGLCRFEEGELDPYMDLRVPSGEALVPGLAGGKR